MRHGLNVIVSRSDRLSRFGADARLAKLPRPQLQPLSVADCVARAVSFETRFPVHGDPGAHPTVQGDPDQLEQAPINLLRKRRRCVAGHWRRRIQAAPASAWC